MYNPGGNFITSKTMDMLNALCQTILGIATPRLDGTDIMDPPL
jgi:hypothetical protein